MEYSLRMLMDVLVLFASSFLLVGAAYYIFCKLIEMAFPETTGGRTRRFELVPVTAKPGEVPASLRSCFVIAVGMVATFYMREAGVSQTYSEINRYGVGYAIFSFFVLLAAFDAWFYATHRLMHILGLRASRHEKHHANAVPSTWGAMSFSIVEISIYVFFFVLICVAMPLYRGAFIMFIVFFILRSAAGHHSYWSRHSASPVWSAFGLMISFDDHLQHHRCTNCNYAIFFTWLDRLFGTYRAHDLAVPAGRKDNSHDNA